jgi:hypothetical protein
MADPKWTFELMTGAGFGTPELVEVRMTWHFHDFEHFWRFSTEIVGAVAMVLRALEDREREAVRGEIERACEPFAAGGGYEMPGVCINGLGS